MKPAVSKPPHNTWILTPELYPALVALWKDLQRFLRPLYLIADPAPCSGGRCPLSLYINCPRRTPCFSGRCACTGPKSLIGRQALAWQQSH